MTLADWPTYDSYKDTDNEWPLKIPTHWLEKRLKHLGTLYAGIAGKSGEDFSKEYQEGYLPFVPFVSVANFMRVPPRFEYVRAKESEGQNKVCKGDIIFLMSSETDEDIGRSALFDLDGIQPLLNSFCKGFRPDHAKLVPAFCSYLLMAQCFRDYFSTSARGFTRINIKQEYILNAPLLLPPLPEQRSIAAFLDEKCAKVDEAVRIKEEQIALLRERRQILIQQAVTRGLNPAAPMKDSGIDWIGQIPAHWEVLRVKQVCRTITKGTTPSTEGRGFAEAGIRYIKAENIAEGQVLDQPAFFIDDATDRTLSRSRLQAFDILFVIAGATIGKSAVLLPDQVPANTNQAVSLLRPNFRNVDPAFLQAWLTTEFVKATVSMGAVQSAQPNISMEDLGNIVLMLPQLDEQKEIVEHLEVTKSKLGDAIAIKEEQIAALKEYKTSLINAAVTGKIKVA